MAPVLSITESELLDAVRAAAVIPDDAPTGAMTAAELREALGLSRDGVKRALMKLRDEGRLTVYRVRRPDHGGRMQVIPAYAITPAKRKR